MHKFISVVPELFIAEPQREFPLLFSKDLLLPFLCDFNLCEEITICKSFDSKMQYDTWSLYLYFIWY